MEREHRDKSWRDLNESGVFAEHRAYVTGAIFAAVAFLEATINELFADTADESAVGSVRPLPPVCNAPPRRRHAGGEAGGRAGAGLVVRRSYPAHWTACRYAASRNPDLRKPA